jgi:hypothetical protein
MNSHLFELRRAPPRSIVHDHHHDDEDDEDDEGQRYDRFLAGWRRAELCVLAPAAVYCLCHVCLPTLFRTRPVTVYHFQRVWPLEAL